MSKVFHFSGYPLYIDIKLVSIMFIACQKASEAASAVIVVNLQLMPSNVADTNLCNMINTFTALFIRYITSTCVLCTCQNMRCHSPIEIMRVLCGILD